MSTSTAQRLEELNELLSQAENIVSVPLDDSPEDADAMLEARGHTQVIWDVIK